jgi:hypothetical protein
MYPDPLPYILAASIISGLASYALTRWHYRRRLRGLAKRTWAAAELFYRHSNL